MNTIERCKPLLGTFVTLQMKVSSSHSEAEQELDLVDYSNLVFEEVARIHDLMGFHNTNSELSKLNRHLLTQPEECFTLSEDMTNVLSFALRLFKDTNGIYDISVVPQLIQQGLLPKHLPLSLNAKAPHKNSVDSPLGSCKDLVLVGNTIKSSAPLCIDLGGIAKGYAVDCAVKKLPKTIEFTLNAGGDLYQSNWQHQKVDIKYGKRIRALKKVNMLNRALATSGNYLRGTASAIINPFSGEPYSLKGSISVFSDQVMISDALTKAVALMRKSQVSALLTRYNAQAIKINFMGLSRKFH